MRAPSPDSAARRDAIARFYSERAGWLQRLVARRATAPPQVIEDACQIAWMHLTRRPDIPLDASGFAWMIVIATREAWTQATPKDQPAGVFIGFDRDQPAELAEPAGPGSDPLELAIAHEEHAERLEAFATLKPRERRDLLLKATGYTYDEIMRLSRAVRVTVAVVLRSDVDDMSLNEASLLPFGLPLRAAVACPRLLLCLHAARGASTC